MIGNLNLIEIDQLLRSQQIGRLGLSGDGRLYIFPVTYGYDGKAICVLSREGMKVGLMRTHPEVCFEVEDITSPARWRTVIAHGAFEELTKEEDRDAAMAVIAAQGEQPLLPSMAPYLDGSEAIVVFRINVTEVTGRFEQEPALPLVGRRASNQRPAPSTPCGTT
jgi:nitroimidazol reductase NimA-like FMN-containing flavoprotein (pyridoxamine 5'-phosphate oxidase superfamily)